MTMKVGGRVKVFGPHGFAVGVAGLVTRVHDDGTVDVTCFPPGSTTGLCVNAIGPLTGDAVGEPRAFYYTPADPEPLAVEMNLQAFVGAIRPLIDTAVAAAVAEKEESPAS